MIRKLSFSLPKLSPPSAPFSRSIVMLSVRRFVVVFRGSLTIRRNVWRSIFHGFKYRALTNLEIDAGPDHHEPATLNHSSRWLSSPSPSPPALSFGLYSLYCQTAASDVRWRNEHSLFEFKKTEVLATLSGFIPSQCCADSHSPREKNVATGSCSL